MKYFHQFDDKGNHRLGTSRRVNGKDTAVRWSKWFPYTSPAKLGQFVAVTDYYKGSMEFPDPTKLYRIQPDVWPLVEIKGSSDNV